MKIELAVEKDIDEILEIIKQRCKWFKENNIEQWGDWYYKELYNKNYFIKMMKNYLLYVAKNENQIIGVFLLKNEDKIYWKDTEKAYYLWHFTTKIGHTGLGENILKFIENLAKENNVKYLRLECMQSNPKINEYYKNHGFEFKGSGEEPYKYNLWEKEIK